MKKTFSVISLIIGIIGILSPIVWDKINKSKKLKIELRSSISILEKDPILDNLSIYFDNNKISSLVKYQFVIQNNGNLPIEENDIKTQPSLTFTDSTKIIAFNINSKSFKEVEFHLSKDSLSSRLLLDFPLLNPDDFVEFVVYVSGCIDCKPRISARIKGISNLLIEDKTIVEPVLKKSLGGFDYVASVIGFIFLIAFFLSYRGAMQHSKVRKLLKESPELINEKNSIEELLEFVASEMFFIDDDEKKEIENILADERTELSNRLIKGKIKIKEYIQDSSGSQIIFYSSIIIVIGVILLIYFRL
nr:hypothetical protein [uncultured Carboxylicivirga sp.]